MHPARLRKKWLFRDSNSGKCEAAEICSAGRAHEPLLPCQHHTSATPVPPPPEPLALSSGRAVAGAWLQAVLFTLLAWAAVVCTGLSGNLGAASQSLANKLAATGAMTQDRVGGHPHNETRHAMLQPLSCGAAGL